MMKPSNTDALLLAALSVVLASLLSCGQRDKPDPPVISHLIYEVSKSLSPNCGPNVLCVDFDGVASFSGTSSSCSDVTFLFDDRSKMTLVVSTQPIFPPTQVNLFFAETDSHSQNIQGPWNITLQSATPNGYWPFKFTVNPTSPDFPITKSSQIKGHYALSVLGGQQVSAATLTIHAEADVVGTNTHLCSAN